MDSQRKACPRCGTPAPLPATSCGRCGHAYRTRFPGMDHPDRTDPPADPSAFGRPRPPWEPPPRVLPVNVVIEDHRPVVVQRPAAQQQAPATTKPLPPEESLSTTAKVIYLVCALPAIYFATRIPVLACLFGAALFAFGAAFRGFSENAAQPARTGVIVGAVVFFIGAVTWVYNIRAILELP
jgi:hypothetical protein